MKKMKHFALTGLAFAVTALHAVAYESLSTEQTHLESNVLSRFTTSDDLVASPMSVDLVAPLSDPQAPATINTIVTNQSDDLSGDLHEGLYEAVAKYLDAYDANDAYDDNEICCLLLRIKNLLRSGVDVNCKDDSTGLTALYIAVRNRNLDIVECLVDAGARPDVVTEQGISPLQTAYEALRSIQRKKFYIRRELSKRLVSRRDTDMIDKLKNLIAQEKIYKAIMHIFQPYFVAMSIPYPTQMHQPIEQEKYATQAHHYIEQKQYDVLHKKLFYDISLLSDLNTQDCFGNTPLMLLLKNGAKNQETLALAKRLKFLGARDIENFNTESPFAALNQLERFLNGPVQTFENEGRMGSLENEDEEFLVSPTLQALTTDENKEGRKRSSTRRTRRTHRPRTDADRITCIHHVSRTDRINRTAYINETNHHNRITRTDRSSHTRRCLGFSV